MKTWLLPLLLPCSLLLPGLAAGQQAASGPPVSISLGSRHAHVTPIQQGFTHTGGGNIDVAQPSPDTVVITMTGVAVAGAHPCKASLAAMNFDIEQCFEIVFDKPETKRAKLTLEGRMVGLLRSHTHGGGSAEQAPGAAVVASGPAEVLALSIPPHSAAGGQNQSVNCREGPVSVSLSSGTYTLCGKWAVTASHPRSLLPCKAASAEFAPDPALDPLWISYWEPFHGAAKKDLGFQITLKVAPETGTEKGNASK
jgi:hypothetical protein